MGLFDDIYNVLFGKNKNNLLNTKKKKKRKDPREEKFIKLQNLVMKRQSDELYASIKELNQATKTTVNSSTKIIGDCVRDVNIATNPDVYFNRFEMLVKHVALMADLEGFYSFRKPLPSAQLRQLLGDRDKAEIAFVNRYLSEVKKAADDLDTEEAKQKEYDKFFETMAKFEGRMTANGIEYVEDLKATIKTII